MKNQMNFFASCPRGLEEMLLEEAKRFSFSHLELTRGGISFKTEPLKAINLMLESRVASRVYKEVGSVFFKNEKDLYTKAKEIPWPKILNPQDEIKVTTILSRDSHRFFKNSHYLSLVLKDSICDVFKDKAGSRPSISLESPDYPFILRVEPSPKGRDHRAIISVDLSGYPLHQRGYRPYGHQAPIKENLAAALVKQTNWDLKAPLYDPFCGSGTLLIEAALIKHQVPATFLKLERYAEGDKIFAFQRQKWFQKDENLNKNVDNLVNELISRGRNGIQSMGVAEFHGNDQSPKAIEVLIKAWAQMGLPRKALRFYQKDAVKFFPDEAHQKGVVITNPPYGVRLEEKNENLLALYHEFGENLKNNWKGFDAYLISQDSDMRKQIGLRTHKRFAFFNGPLECRLLGYELF